MSSHSPFSQSVAYKGEVKMKLFKFVVSIVIPAFLLAATVACPVMGQETAKAPAKGEVTVKVLFENAKVKVTENRFPAGSVSPSSARPGRVVHTVKGGTLLRTHPDGKKVTVVTKAGETRWLEADTYEVKNAGKSEIVLHVVIPK
jgi:hypothetical protein